MVARDFEKHNFHEPIRIEVAQAENLRPDFRLDRQFFREFPPQRGFQLFALFDLAAGKLPLQAVSIGVVALTDQDAVVTSYDACSDQNGLRLGHQRMRL